MVTRPFIHSGYFYSKASSPPIGLLRGVPNTARILKGDESTNELPRPTITFIWLYALGPICLIGEWRGDGVEIRVEEGHVKGCTILRRRVIRAIHL